VIYPDFPDTLHEDYNTNANAETSSQRIMRQTNNRRPPNGGPQTFPPNNEEDPFDGFETPVNQGASNGNQFQWSNNGNNQWPNNQQQGNRPQNQNQWSNQGSNQAQWPTNGNQQQNFGGRPQGQNQRPNNNGGNQGSGNNRPTNQNQNQQQTFPPASNGEISEEQRNTCNTNCKERNTNEYNPVCGSDSLTYQNRRFLNCVANCGIRKRSLFNIFR